MFEFQWELVGCHYVTKMWCSWSHFIRFILFRISKMDLSVIVWKKNYNPSVIIFNNVPIDQPSEIVQIMFAIA